MLGVGNSGEFVYEILTTVLPLGPMALLASIALAAVVVFVAIYFQLPGLALCPRFNIFDIDRHALSAMFTVTG